MLYEVLEGSARDDWEWASGKAFLARRRYSCMGKHTCVPISWTVSSQGKKDDGVRKLPGVSKGMNHI